jgi:hypothetical protein
VACSMEQAMTDQRQVKSRGRKRVEADCEAEAPASVRDAPAVDPAPKGRNRRPKLSLRYLPQTLATDL